MEIYCDESGYTGVDLLEVNQPYFSYSGVKLNQEDKDKAIRLIHNNYRIQGEIKAKNLLQNELGQKAILKLFEAYATNARVVFCDKKFALAAKIFEYAIEPNLRSNYTAYESGFNVFIANGLYSYFSNTGTEAEKLFSLFLAELRGRATKDSIFHVEHHNLEELIPWWVLEIVKFNPDKFYSEIKTDGEIDGWILDLTSTCMMGLLTEWSKKGDDLTVICDNSNLFKSNQLIEALNTMGRANAKTDFLGITIGFNLKKDIQTAISKMEPGLQIADIFASTVAYCLKKRDTKFSKAILGIVAKNCLCRPASFCVMPDYKITDDKEKIDFYLNFMRVIWKEQRKGLQNKR